MTDTPQMTEAIRRGCNEAYGKCAWPACECRGVPAAIRAAVTYAITEAVRDLKATLPEDMAGWEHVGPVVPPDGRETARRKGSTCPFGDPHCPCQEGDACHYRDYPDSPACALPPVYAQALVERLESAEQDALRLPIGDVPAGWLWSVESIDSPNDPPFECLMIRYEGRKEIRFLGCGNSPREAMLAAIAKMK